VRGLRRLRRAVQLPERGAAGNRVWPQAPRINQSTCNKDYSCVKGFCPSFVTVEGGQLKKKGKGNGASPFELGALPEPLLPVLKQAWGIVVAGVGGTGVITIGQLLGVAAHLEGKGIVTQDAGGLAQKGGATWSHVLIGATQDDIRTTRVSMAAADLIIGCDPIVTAGKETVLRMREGRTHVALNAQGTPTAAFVKNANWQNPSDQCVADITRAVGEAGVGLFNADAVAGKLMGDTIYVNPMILGYAWQKGWIPLGTANRCYAPSNSTLWRWRTTRPRLSGAGRPPTTARGSMRCCRRARLSNSRNARRWTAWWRAVWSSSPPIRTRLTRPSTRRLSRRCGPQKPRWARPRSRKASRATCSS
jgi:Pyruvate/2-oxoacid:ferredoxin oxidoreductase gamma subunit